MKVKMERGFEGFDSLKNSLNDYKGLPVTMDYVEENYKDSFMTAKIAKGKYKIKGSSSNNLAMIDNDSIFIRKAEGLFEEGEPKCGVRIPLKEGNKYLIGRGRPINCVISEVYCVIISPDGTKEKTEVVNPVLDSISRAQLYIEDLGETLKIVRLGITPINVESLDNGDNIIF